MVLRWSERLRSKMMNLPRRLTGGGSGSVTVDDDGGKIATVVMIREFGKLSGSAKFLNDTNAEMNKPEMNRTV